MKKLLSVFAFFWLLTGVAMAQILIKKHSRSSRYAITQAEFDITQHKYRAAVSSAVRSNHQLPVSPWGTAIGTTFFDMQSYGGVGNRIIKSPDGSLAAVWHSGRAQEGRTVGYNRFDGNTWIMSDTSLNELTTGDPAQVNRRTGWPTIAQVDNKEVISFYTFPNATSDDNGMPFLATYTRVAGETSWQQDTTELGGYFFKSAAAGSKLYVIGTSSTAQNGVANAFTFNRSSDGGQTWDISNLVMPDVSSTNYTNFRADEYAIDAKDNVVVIAAKAVTPSPNLGITNVLYRSDNYGEAGSWTVKTISSTTSSMLDSADFYEAPFWSIPSTDGVFSVVLDNNNLAHVSVGTGITPVNDTGAVSNAVYTNAGRSFNLLYWNENMTSFDTIASLTHPAINPNLDSLAAYLFNAPNSQFGIYWGGLCSYSSIAVDETNNIYVVFSALVERTRRNAQDNKATRDIFVVKKDNVVGNWSAPMNIGRDLAGEGDPGTPELGASPDVEDMFPAAIKRIGPDGMLDILWIADRSAGNSTWPAGNDPQTHEPEIASVTHYAVPVAEVVTAANKRSLAGGSVLLYPNPVEDVSTLRITLDKAANVSVVLRNVLGQEVLSTSGTFLGAREEGQIQLDLSSLQPGVYMYTIQAGEQSLSRKLVKK